MSTLREDRLKKIAHIKEAKISPYPSTPFIKEKIIDILKKEVGIQAKSAGRVTLFRDMGNITFLNLKDESGKIQIVLNKKEFKGDYKFWLKNLDLGDYIGVSGTRFDTQRGEKSLLAQEITLLAKAVLPLPDKFHGLTDDEERQRFRELEMIADDEVFDKFKRRSLIIKALRKFMWDNDFTEIETPILQTVYGGTYAKPFMTHYNALDFDLYLRIAPELFLKRAVVGGFEKVFEIGKCFRNEGMDPSHLQEFTMFEFYWAYADYEKLMDFSEKMIEHVVGKTNKGFKIKIGQEEIDLKPPYPRCTFRELVKEHWKVDLSHIDTVPKVKEFIKKNNLSEQVNLKGKTGWAQILDEVYKKTIRKKLVQPIFVTDYPKEFQDLAKTKEDEPDKVATFHLVINSWEIIKAYNELNDPLDQKERFEKQERLAMKGDEEAMPYDHDFLKSMEYGMPPMAGWGMGLDRFISLLEAKDNLRDQVIFPTMKRKK